MRPRSVVAAAAIVAVTWTSTASAQATRGADTARLDAIAREAAQRFADAQTSAPSAATPARAPSETPTIALTLDEAVSRGLEHNLDIAVERLNPQTYDLSIAGLRSVYRPTLTSTFGQRSVVNAPSSQLNGGSSVTNDTTTYNAGLSQAVPWGGGSASVAFNNTRLGTNNLFANYNPSYTAVLSASYVQPLLRGFRIDQTRQQITTTRISREIADVNVKAVVTGTLAAIRDAYWDLVYSIQAVDVASQSLRLAQKLVEDNTSRVEVGTMAPIDVVQAEAEAATRRQALAQAEATWRLNELALKRLIVGGTDDPLWKAQINPVDRPAFQPQPLNVEQAVTNALSARTDLTQARKQLDSADVTIGLYRNQTLPALDLIATYGAQGLGGTQFIRQGSGLGSQVIGEVPGGYGDAWSALTARRYPTWNVGLSVSYPIGASSADAQLARARVQRNQTAAQVRALELQVATEVTNIALQVDSNLKQLEASTAARELALRRLEAEQSKFEVGMSTNFFVVQAQRDLADAQNTELRAAANYRKSLVDYERVQVAPAARTSTSVSGSGGSTASTTSRGSTGSGATSTTGGSSSSGGSGSGGTGGSSGGGTF